MSIKLTTTFETVAQRIIYALTLIYSDSAPTEQKRLYELMGLMVDKLYENPKLLNLSEHEDEAYQSWEVNNRKPELDKIFKSVYKGIYEFYNFLYIASLHGEIKANCLQIGSTVLKEHKAGYRPQYKTLLSEVGIDVIKDKTSVSITADNELLQSLKLLAEKVPVNTNPWTSYELINFACCSFTNNFDYLLLKTDELNNLQGLLPELQKRCLEEGYALSIENVMKPAELGYKFTFKNKIGGFVIEYHTRKYQQFSFGTINGIGEKAMIDDFENLDKDLQEHFVNICKICDNCLICTKNGKNKVFAVNVAFDGKEYNLCPSYPRHGWDTIDRKLVDVLFKYHATQEKYGVNWKKR